MASKPIGPIRKAWLSWKSLKLPWRKQFFIGHDLKGNTFWEFKDTLSSNRMRRIVKYPSRSVHYSEIKITPQWHQWLRHTRYDPPSITEQSQDLVRQENLKILAAEADARWAAKPSFLDAPGMQQGQPLPAIGVKDPGGYATLTESMEKKGVRNAVGGGLEDNVQDTEPIMRGLEAEKAQLPDDQRRKQTTEASRDSTSTFKPKTIKEDPWKKARGGPSEEWTPKAWDPNARAGNR